MYDSNIFHNDNSEDTDEIGFIYSLVAEKIERDLSLSEFDSETLIDVYDYAYQIPDDYVCDEIINWFRKTNPRSLPMLERRTVHYALDCDIDAANHMLKKLPAHSFIRRLVRNYLDNREQLDFDSLLSGLKPRSINEFGGITLIDFIMAGKGMDSLTERLTTLEPLLHDAQYFLEDLGQTLLSRKEYKQASTVYKRLTHLAPFNIKNWNILADIYLHYIDNCIEARNSIEYALAIEPNNKEALLRKAELLVKNHGDMTEALKITDSLVYDENLRADALYVKAGILIKQDSYEEAENVLYQYSDYTLNPLKPMVLAASFFDSKPLSQAFHETLKRHLAVATDEDVEEWVDSCTRFLTPALSRQMMLLLSEYRTDVPEELYPRIILALYQMKRYKDAIRFFEEKKMPLISSSESSSEGVGSTLTYLFSLTREKDTRALDFISNVFDYLDSSLPDTEPNAVLFMHQYQLSLTMLRDWLNGEIKDLKIDNFDPFFIETD